MKRLLLLLSLISLFSASEGFSLCARDPRAGTWYNVDPNTPSIKKVVYTQVCNDVIACPIDGPCPRPDNRDIIQLFGSCTPTLCDWGKKRLDRYNDFWDLTTYEFSFKTTKTWVHYYPDSKQLLVVTQDNYKDDRPDKQTYNYFKQ